MSAGSIQHVPLSELLDRLIDYRGKTPKKSASGVKLVTAKVIKDGRIADGNHEYIPEADYDAWMRRGLPKQWDILITTEAPLGEVAMLRTPERVALAQRVILLRANARVVDQRYLFQALKSPLVQGRLRSRGTGTTVLGIKQSEIVRVEIPIRPLAEQRRIASILSAYDDLIENNTRRIAILEEMARRIYEEWFVRFRFPGHERVRMVESELGPVPDGWGCVAFTELAEVLSGGTPKKSEASYWNGEIPFFTPKDAPKSAYVLDTESHVTTDGLDHCASRLYPKDTVFITARGTVGKLALASRDMAMNQSCYALKPQPGYGQQFLYFATQSVVEDLRAKSHGAVFDTIIMDTFRLMKALLPPMRLAARFDNVVRPMLSLSLALTQTNANLRTTRDLLLPRLISGELDVSALPEPEAVAA